MIVVRKKNDYNFIIKKKGYGEFALNMGYFLK